MAYLLLFAEFPNVCCDAYKVHKIINIEQEKGLGEYSLEGKYFPAPNREEELIALEQRTFLLHAKSGELPP